MAKEVVICPSCGRELTDENSIQNTAICLNCQSEHYKVVEEDNGAHLAIFICCVAYNIPCLPLICPIDIVNYEGDKWLHYVELLDEKGELADGSRVKTFKDGVHDIRKIFGKELTQSDFARYVASEQSKAPEHKNGTPLQRAVWGEKDNYTDEEYNELDRMYENRAVNFKGQTITEQMEYTLREVAKWQLMADKMRRISNIKSANEIWKVIDSLLASECLRKKDEKPTEEFRPDAWIVAFENSGFMKDGDFLPRDEMIKAIAADQRKSGYKQTLDAAQQLLLNIVNNARKNADQSTIYELPEDMAITDEYGEFAKEEGESEKKAKAYANLPKVRIKKGKK